MTRAKWMKLIALMMVATLALAGCGGNGAPAPAEEPENGEETGTPVDAPAEELVSVQWIANSVWPQNNHHSVGLNEFAQKLSDGTDGRVQLDVQVGGALGFTGPDLLRAVRDNLIPVSDMLSSGVAGDEQIFEIVTLPFLVLSFEEARTLTNIARPYFDEIAENKWNQKILYVAPWPAAGIWAQREIYSMSDMSGLRTRTYDRNGALVIEAVGATPYPLPFSEVYSSLATGVIDSVLTSSPTAVDASFWEVLDYFAPLSVTTATNMVTVNLNEFNKLDSASQAIVLEIAAEMEEAMWQNVAALDMEMQGIANDNGIETLIPDADFLSELSAITEGIRAEWLAEAPPEAQEILDKFYDAIDR